MRVNLARTLIIKPSSMGDIVHALPVLTALREAAPEARIDWLVARPFTGLLADHPRLDRLVIFDRHELARAGREPAPTAALGRFMWDLRQARYTAVLDLQGLFRSGAFALATGAPARIGFAGARELARLAYTVTVDLARAEHHAVDRYLGLARRIGAGPPTATDHLPVAAEARKAVRRRLAEMGVEAGRSFVAICPYARWETKLWPPERFAEVADRLAEATGEPSVLLGSGAAGEAARKISAASAGRVLDLTGRTTLKEMVAVLAESRVLVTNDSGPMHVAAAVGTPVVAVFGPTSPARTGPYGEGHRVVVGEASCRPCYRRRCVRDGAEALACLRSISARDVAQLAAGRGTSFNA